jgi:hypothetical protein
VEKFQTFREKPTSRDGERGGYMIKERLGGAAGLRIFSNIFKFHVCLCPGSWPLTRAPHSPLYNVLYILHKFSSVRMEYTHEIKLRPSRVRMRSSRVVRASDCQYHIMLDKNIV